MTEKPSKTSPAISGDEAGTPKLTTSGRGGRWLAAVGAGTALAAAALLNQLNARRAERQNPPAGKFVDVDGVRLHYVDRGTGPVVVLLHGNGVMLQDFEVSGVLGLAAERYRVLAFDRPGFGYSDRPRTTVWTPSAQADLIARALTQLGVERAVVVGHSWGTMVALSMAVERPALVAGLVLLSGYYYGTARPDVVPGSLPAIPLVGDLMAHTISPLAGLLIGPAGVKASFAPAPVPEKFAELPVAMTLRPSQVRATAADTAMMVPAAIALSSQYGALALPVVIMAGEGDLIVHKEKHAERLAGDIAEADLRTVPGQGHLLHYAVPDQVIGAIDSVVERAV